MKKDETFEEWCNSVDGNAQIDMELSMARTHLSECWNHQQKKIDTLEAKLAKAVEAFVEIRRYNGDTTKVENIIRQNLAQLS